MKHEEFQSYNSSKNIKNKEMFKNRNYNNRRIHKKKLYVWTPLFD